MSYKKPTLIEQYVAFSFRKDTLSQAKMFDVVPALKKIGFDTVEVVNIEQSSINDTGQIQRTIIPRFRCWNRDHDNLVQLAPDQVFINKVGKYLGWKDFSQMYLNSLSIIKENIEFSNIEGIAFNTVDVMNVFNNAPLGKYLNCGEIIPMWYSQIKESFDISLGRGFLQADKYNKHIQLIGREINNEYQIKISSLFQKLITQPIISIDYLSNEIENLHEESNTTFESMITDYTRENILGGIINANV